MLKKNSEVISEINLKNSGSFFEDTLNELICGNFRKSVKESLNVLENKSLEKTEENNGLKEINFFVVLREIQFNFFFKRYEASKVPVFMTLSRY